LRLPARQGRQLAEEARAPGGRPGTDARPAAAYRDPRPAAAAELTRPVLGVDLGGRAAVVTGGGRGIGAAVARTLAEAGARVLVCARSGAAVEQLAAELAAGGHEAYAVECDVADEAAVEHLRVAALDRLGRVEILVNNAGSASSAPLHRQTLDEWRRLFEVNVQGTFL